MSRLATFAARLLSLAGAVVLLAGCGAPPEPLPSGPPKVYGSGQPSGAGAPYPGAAAPTYPAPPGGLPGNPYPTPPAYPTAPAPTVRPPTPGPPPAPKCTGGPSAAQVLAVIKGKPGIPADQNPEVKEGPYCAGTWQFAIVGVVGKTLDEVDPLLVVTTGKASALKLVEAGADVCSDHVQKDAPAGIRVRACGS